MDQPESNTDRLRRVYQFAHLAFVWFVAFKTRTKTAVAAAVLATVPVALAL